MAFDPQAWLETAGRLGAFDDEASLRAAAGRWYYGVWLKTLLSLENDGVFLRRNSRDDHSAVPRVLRDRRRAAAGMAMRHLARLRERADYETERPFTRADERDAARFAAEVARLLAPDWSRLPR